MGSVDGRKRSEHCDFLSATFTAALVTRLAGFAFGLVAAVWLHVLSPLQTATLIIAFGLVVQGVSVWKLREALHWSRLWPILVGAALGVPLGVAVRGWARPDHVRVGVGVLLILFSTYSRARPSIKRFTAGGALADAGTRWNFGPRAIGSRSLSTASNFTRPRTIRLSEQAEWAFGPRRTA